MADINIRAPLETAMFTEQKQMARPWQDYFGTLKNKLDEALARIEVEIDAEIVDLNVTGNYLMDDVIIIDEFKNIVKIVDVGAETLTISGAATIGGGLAVTGDVSGSTATISGNATVGGDIGVTGDANIATDANVTGDVNVTGNIDGAAITGDSLSVTGDVGGATATLTGAITGASIDVTGEVGGNTLDIASTADIDGTLDVGGILTAETSADVVGALTAGSMASDATVSSTTTMTASGELRADNGILRLKETTTPTPVDTYAYIYSTDVNELFWTDGAGTEHLLHGDSFSDLWYNGDTTPVAIAAQNKMALINIMESIRGEDDLLNAVASTANNEITIGANGGGVYIMSHHSSVTVAGGAKKGMMIAAGIEFATPRDITNVTDDTVSPIIVTSNGHGILKGDMIEIAGVLVNLAANGSFRASAVDTNTITLINLDGTATTGDGDYDEGTPTGDITHCYPGDLASRRIVNQTDIGAMSAGGLVALVAGDKVALYVANLADASNLSVFIASIGIDRVGD